MLGFIELWRHRYRRISDAVNIYETKHENQRKKPVQIEKRGNDKFFSLRLPTD